MKKFDCIVIGSGPAGFYSALSCAKKGFKTAIIEKEYLGGTGFRTGCLPVKRNLDILQKTREAVSLSSGNFSLSENFYRNLLTNTQKKISGVENIIRSRLSEADVSIFSGAGEFLDNKTFKIGNSKLETEYFIIATGTSPSAPEGIFIDGKKVISHIEALNLRKLPEKIVIIGGNVEGIEMAVLFSSLGVTVTVIELDPRILEGTDRDLVEPVLKNLDFMGVSIVTGISAESVDTDGSKPSVILASGKVIEGDHILVTGLRKPNIPEGLETTGVLSDKKGIPVNKTLQTNVPNIFASGDINGIHGMAHIAIQQGMRIAEGIKGTEVVQDYRTLPRAMFTIPEIAGAGVQECELINSNIEYTVKKYEIKNTWRGFSRNNPEGFIKLIFNGSDILTGIWMTGTDASGIMTGSGILIDKNISGTDLKSNLFIHPTVGEGIIEALFIDQ